MIYNWANWWGLPWGGVNGPNKWCTAPLMAIILTPSVGDWMLMPEEAICKEELYFRMCLRKDTVAGGRRAPGAGLEVSRSRNGWGGGMGKSVEGIHIHSNKSKHSNVITHSTVAQNWKSTQSLPSLADRVIKLIYPAAATTQLWLRSYQPGYAVV